MPIQAVPAPLQPVQPPQLSAVQRLLIRIFQPALAGNALFGITLGGLLAVGLGVLASFLLVVLAHAIASHLDFAEELVDRALGIAPLRAPFRDGLQLLVVMHGAGLHFQDTFSSSASTTPNVITFASFAVLNGLLVVPALLLTLGGYIAASTDLRNNVRDSLLRGAGIAVPYTIVLLILMTQVNGCVPFSNGSSASYTCSSGGDSVTLTVDILMLLGFGLLWGIVFGVLGASLKLARGHWVSMIRRFLGSVSRPQVAGMITGGLAATGLGVALSLLFLYGLLVYSTASIPLFANILCYRSADWQTMTTWAIAQGPLHAVNIFLFSFAAPVTFNTPSQLGGGCFYINDPHATLSLINGLTTTTSGGSVHLSPWFYAFLVLPIVVLFFGGRVSAAISRAQGIGPGAIQGALIAVPFTVLMLLLSLISTITNAQTGSFSSTSSTSSGVTYVQSAGVAPMDLLLWALLFSAVLGAVGGAYQTSSAKVVGSKVASALGTPLKLLGMPLSLLLDRLSGRPRSTPPSTARSLLYGAFFCAVLVAIVAGIAGALFINLNQTMGFDVNQRIRDILSVIVVVLPGILLIAAGASALAARDPAAPASTARPVTPMWPNGPTSPPTSYAPYRQL